MAKFNYKKWVTENKHGKLSEYRDENPFDQEISDDPNDPRQFQKYQEIEKDPDAQAAAPKKGGEGEKEAKPPLDPSTITAQTSYGDLSGEEDAKNILQQILTADPNQPIFKAQGKFANPKQAAAWVKEKGIDTLAKRMVAIGKALPATGLPKKDMPFLPGPDDAAGSVDDVGDALTPGGKYGVDFKEVYDFLNEKTDPPAPNTFVGMDDKAAQDYMQSGEKDGDPKDDAAAFNKDPSIAASAAVPTQSNILIAKSIGMAANGVEGGDLGAYFSTDNEILDGHHRWAATMLNNPGADMGGFAAIDLKAMGGTKQALKHLTAIGNALGNKTKTSEAKDPRASLYERMEKLINK